MKKGDLKYLAEFHWKTLVLESVLESPTQVSPCEICKNFKDTYFEEHLLTAASGFLMFSGGTENENCIEMGLRLRKIGRSESFRLFPCKCM